MEIKTSEEIVDLYNGGGLKKDFFRETKWIAVDDMLKLIDKHKHCSKYHKIKKKDGIYKGTCVYKIYEELSNSRPSGADNSDFKAHKSSPKDCFSCCPDNYLNKCTNDYKIKNCNRRKSNPS